MLKMKKATISQPGNMYTHQMAVTDIHAVPSTQV
jgi:hypothetical protein